MTGRLPRTPHLSLPAFLRRLFPTSLTLGSALPSLFPVAAEARAERSAERSPRLPAARGGGRGCNVSRRPRGGATGGSVSGRVGPWPREVVLQPHGSGRLQPSPWASRAAPCRCRSDPLGSRLLTAADQTTARSRGPPESAVPTTHSRTPFLPLPAGGSNFSHGVLWEVAESMPLSASRSWVPTHARRQPP